MVVKLFRFKRSKNVPTVSALQMIERSQLRTEISGEITVQ